MHFVNIKIKPYVNKSNYKPTMILYSVKSGFKLIANNAIKLNVFCLKNKIFINVKKKIKKS